MQKITPYLWFDDNAEEADELLRFHFQELEDHFRVALRRRRAGPARQGHDQRPLNLTDWNSWRSTAARNSNSPRPSRCL